LWFYEEPSPTEEYLFCLRHLYRFFEELFNEMVLWRTLVEKVLCGSRNGALKNHVLRFFETPL